jgi:hypothetical protein
MVKYVVDKDYDNGLLFSAGRDFTLKLWDLAYNEIKSEFFAPKKECLSFDIIPNYKLFAGGFNDGFLRFFEYSEY